LQRDRTSVSIEILQLQNILFEKAWNWNLFLAVDKIFTDSCFYAIAELLVLIIVLAIIAVIKVLYICRCAEC